MKYRLWILIAIMTIAAIAALFMQNRDTGDPMDAGKKFLEENATKEGVKTTPSGLQYEVLRDGTGPKPSASSTVEVHYEGRLTNGAIFDSSYQRKETISFPLNRVIPGWTEGLQLMPTGSKYRLYIPSELGYGARGAGADIPPNATLIFDVELISIR
jgi:FKBP-type peptidyl-prolyl cis-trans isomerase